jgi:hypothetical protein
MINAAQLNETTLTISSRDGCSAHHRRGVSVDQADGFIHGYTCVNGITAAEIIGRDATFVQWAREGLR